MPKSALRAATGLLVLACVAAGVPSAGAVTYCDPFNDALLTSILDGFDACGFHEATFSDAVEECGDEILVLPGAPGAELACDFCFWAELAGFESESGYVALDEVGLPPGHPGFRDAALNAPSITVLFEGAGPGNDEPGDVTSVVLDANREYVFWLVQDATLDEARADPGIPVFFSLVAANTDAFDHFKSLTSAANDGAVVFAWEDLLGGGDEDFTDTVFTTSCAFVAAPLLCQPRTQGFWKRQCARPHPSRENEALDAYATCVNDAATFSDVADGAAVCDRLSPSPSRDKCEQAEAQLMALLLNTCSGRLSPDCCIDSELTGAETVGEAITEIDGLLSNAMRSFQDCERAQAIADAINRGVALCPE